jgi:putative spermidine/putrescine transport system permease protein
MNWAETQRSEWWWSLARQAVSALAVIYLVAPLIIVLVISFSSAPFLTFPPPGFSLQWYHNLFNNPAWSGSLMTSVKILVPAALIATITGWSVPAFPERPP